MAGSMAGLLNVRAVECAENSSAKERTCTDTDTDIRLPQNPVLMPTVGSGQGTRARTRSALNCCCSAGMLAWPCSAAHLRLDYQFAVQPRALSTANHQTTQPSVLTFSPNKYTISRPSIQYTNFHFPHQFQVRGETVLFSPIPPVRASLPPPAIRAPHATCSKL